MQHHSLSPLGSLYFCVPWSCMIWWFYLPFFFYPVPLCFLAFPIPSPRRSCGISSALCLIFDFGVAPCSHLSCILRFFLTIHTPLLLVSGFMLQDSVFSPFFLPGVLGTRASPVCGASSFSHATIFSSLHPSLCGTPSFSSRRSCLGLLSPKLRALPLSFRYVVMQ